MFNFITNLLNINENEVEDLKVVSLPSETQFHITLFPTFPSCPYCGGTVQGHGHTKPKRINHSASINLGPVKLRNSPKINLDF